MEYQNPTAGSKAHYSSFDHNLHHGLWAHVIQVSGPRHQINGDAVQIENDKQEIKENLEKEKGLDREKEARDAREAEESEESEESAEVEEAREAEEDELNFCRRFIALQQEWFHACEMADFYRHERDYFRSLANQLRGSRAVHSRPPSPQFCRSIQLRHESPPVTQDDLPTLSGTGPSVFQN